jgi:hypothetical protein
LYYLFHCSALPQGLTSPSISSFVKAA